MSKSVTAINNYLKHEFTATPILVSGSTLYINLCSSGSVPIDTSNGYSSASMTRDTTDWITSSPGEISNGVVISFPSGSAVSLSDWGTITGVSISTSSNGASPLYYSALSPSIEAPQGTKITFGGGTLKFTRIDRLGG